MKNDIEDLINSKLDDESSLYDMYDTNVEEEIEEKVKKQNEIVTNENYRKNLLKKLKEISEVNSNIVYDENLNIEELEKIINKCEI